MDISKPGDELPEADGAANASTSTPVDRQKLANLLAARPRAALARFCNPSARARLKRALKRRYERSQRQSNRQKANRYRDELRRGFLLTTNSELCGLAPIHASAMCGKRSPIALDVVLGALDALPKRERDVDVRDDQGLSALAHAVLADYGDGVRKLVKAGADVRAPFCDRKVEDWKRVPGDHASLLSFAVFLNSMSAFRALIECGAKASDWDRSGMRPVHVAVLCGNLNAVRDLVAIDSADGPMNRKKAVELYTVREKYMKSQSNFDMGQGADDDDDDPDHIDHSEPLGDEPISIPLGDNDDDDETESNGPPWGFDASAHPNSSRVFYRSLTADLDDFDIEESTRITDDGSNDGDMSDAANMLGLDDNDMDNDIGGSEDEESIPDLDMNFDGDEEMTDANDDQATSDDAKLVSELLALLQGSLKHAIARAERRRRASAQSASTTRPETNGTMNRSDDGADPESAPSEDSSNQVSESQMHIVRGADGTETRIVQMGDVVSVSLMPGSGPEETDSESEGQQIYLQVLAAVFKALHAYQKEFYGANLLHLAARQKQHDVMRYLLESAPFAQSISDRENDGLTALHVAAEVDDPVAVEMLLASGADINARSDTESTTALMIASYRGYQKTVKCLLENGARVDEEDDEGRTALHYAAEKLESEKDSVGKEEIVALLVGKGANVNAQTADGNTPVYTAAGKGHFKVFMKLLELGSDPSISNYDGSVPLGFIATKSMKELAVFAEFVAAHPNIKDKMNMDSTVGDQGQTALHIACTQGDPAAVKALIAAGADCNKLNEHGNSALMMISRQEDVNSDDRYECMKALVEADANVRVAGEEGKQAIHFVTFLGEPECVELLLKNGADASAVTNSKTPLHLVALANVPEIAEILLKHGAKLNALDQIQMTPLMYATLKHSVEVIKILIAAGADLTQQAEGGMTALHIAAVTPDPRAEETVQLLCEAGAPMDVRDDQGMCPIHLHSDFERTRCVRRLLMCGCDPNLRCEAGFTPLIRACNSRNSIEDNMTLVRILLRAGADVNAKNDNDNTVMSYLGDTEDYSMIRVMLAAGADINVRDKQGDTPLHEAAMGNHPKTVSLLVRRGAEVNARNEEMQTPLFIAAQKGFSDVVKALLQQGVKADISIPDKLGKTPYDAARDAGHDSIASMLLDATGLRLSQFAPLKTFDIHQTPAQSFDLQGADGDGALRRHDSGRLLCVTCQEGLRFGEQVRELPCGHAFHDPCILPWVGGEKMTNNRTCPVCKQLVAPANLFPPST